MSVANYGFIQQPGDQGRVGTWNQLREFLRSLIVPLPGMLQSRLSRKRNRPVELWAEYLKRDDLMPEIILPRLCQRSMAPYFVILLAIEMRPELLLSHGQKTEETHIYGTAVLYASRTYGHYCW